MFFYSIQEYYAHIRGKVARCGYSHDWSAIKVTPSSRTVGIVKATPLRFKDGAILNFYEEIVLNDAGLVFRPGYAYHYERSSPIPYFFRYDRDPLYARPIVHEECHLHVNQKEPRFKTHVTGFDEVFDFILAGFYQETIKGIEEA